MESLDLRVYGLEILSKIGLKFRLRTEKTQFIINQFINQITSHAFY